MNDAEFVPWVALEKTQKVLAQTQYLLKAANEELADATTENVRLTAEVERMREALKQAARYIEDDCSETALEWIEAVLEVKS